MKKLLTGMDRAFTAITEGKRGTSRVVDVGDVMQFGKEVTQTLQRQAKTLRHKLHPDAFSAFKRSEADADLSVPFSTLSNQDRLSSMTARPANTKRDIYALGFFSEDLTETSELFSQGSGERYPPFMDNCGGECMDN